MSKKRTSLENYTLLLFSLQKLKPTKFTVKSFIRKIRPFCKTNNLGNKLLFIRIRGSEKGISIEIRDDCFIVCENRLIHEYIFYTECSKHLLIKLLEHNLLIP